MDSLVKRLSIGTHPIAFESRTTDFSEIKERLDHGFVFVTFTGTRGGTELGINVEPKLSNFEAANFEAQKGSLRIIGTCEIDYQKVRCIAEVDLSTKQGIGHLELIES
jgi:hypothetical protein